MTNHVRALNRIERGLLRRSAPRFHMGLIVAVTGLAGFLCSYLLLQAGMTSMAVRYPTSAVLAYAVFLLQLRLRIAGARRRFAPDLGDDLASELLNFDGVPMPDVDIDLDEAALLVVPILIVTAGVLGVFYVIYAAPALFAELILDAVIVSRLYRRFKHLEPEGWLLVSVRRTWLPLLGLVVMLALAGFAARMFVPAADSIGDLFRTR